MFFSIQKAAAQVVNLENLINRKDLTLKEIETIADNHFKVVGTGKGSGYKIFQRWLYEQKFHVDKDGYKISREHEFSNYESALRQLDNKNTAERSVANWTELGPTSWNATSSWNPGVGRLTSVAIHPSNESIIYVSSPGGGIWKSSNAGVNWTPLIDNVNAAWMDIYNLCITPTNQNVIYAGISYGGIIKSSDAGLTWAATGNGPYGIRKIIVNPNDATIVLAITLNGIWRSTNAGASWTNVNSMNDGVDIEFKANDPAIILASFNSNTILRSVNNGITWTSIPLAASGRTMLAVSPNNANIVYAVQSRGAMPQIHTFGRFYKSTDAGQTFTTLITGSGASGTNYFGYSTTGVDTVGQAWHDMAICVNPTNVNEVHIAGVACWKSLNGGTSFTAETAWFYPNSIGYNHADVHSLEWVNSTIYSTSDGGIYKSTNNGDDWNDLSSGIGIRQFYRIACAKTNANMMTGGAQDNGSTFRQAGGNWLEWLGADGMDAVISPTNPNIAIGTSQLGAIYKTTNAGGSRVDLTQPSPGNWITPLAMHPTNHDTVYGGWTGIYRSDNGGGSWNLISGTTITGQLNCLTLAPSNPRYIYGSIGSTIYRTANAGATWSAVSSGTGEITSICVSPLNPQKIWITTSDFFNNVLVSVNMGTTLTSISTGLPSIPARSIVVDNEAAEGLYVGMNIGVYYRDNINTAWILHTNGLPLVAINEVELQLSSRKVRVATYGRGVWESDMQPSANSNAGPDVTVNCTNPSTTLTATGGVSFLWSTGATTASIIVSPLTTTIYTVTVTSAGGGTSTDAVQVTTDKIPPIANAGADITITSGTTTSLTATGGGAYLWSTGATSATISISPSATTTYSVTVTSANGCTAVDAVLVTIGTTASCVLNTQIPTQALILAALNGFTYDNTGLTSVTESEAMLNYMCANVSVHAPAGDARCGTFGTGYHITIWINTYGKTNTYGIRFGNQSNHAFWGSNATYFEIEKSTTPALPLAYMSNRAANTVSVINTSTNAVVITVNVGTNPEGVGISNSFQKAFVANYGSNSVSVINTATNTVVATIPTVANPTGVAVHPDGSKVYVSHANSVTVINASTNTVITNFAAGITSIGITLNPNGSKLYVVSFSEHLVKVFDANTFQLINNIAVDQNPVGVVISPDGGKLYVGCATTKTLKVINAITYATIATVTCNNNTSHLDISPDGSKVYVVNGLSNNISVVNTATNSVVATIAIGANPAGVSFTPNGAKAFVGNSSNANVSVINTATNTVSATVTVGVFPYAYGKFITGFPVPNVVYAGADISINCTNPSTTLAATGNVISYLWSTGETTASITVAPVTTTTYTITATNSSGNTSVDDIKVTVDKTAPTANAGANATVNCTSPSTTTTATGGGTYAWNNGATQGGTVTPTTTTTYTVTVTSTNGCTATANKVVTVDKTAPTANAGANVTVNCTSPSTTTTATGGGTYAWNNGATQGGTVTPTTTTTYTVTVTGTNGCTATANKVVTVDKAAPLANAGANVTVNCTSPSTTMTATGGGTYAWNNGATQGGTVSPTITTTYTVTVTGTNGCTATANKIVTVDKAAPSANAGANVTVNCTTPSTTMTATGGGTYTWNNGATQGGTVTPTTTTTYTVTVTGTNGCTATANKVVTVDKTAPTANAGADVTITSGASTTLTASGVGSYLWSNGGNTAAILVSPTTTTTYTVTVTGANGCTASDAVIVTVTGAAPTVCGLSFSSPSIIGNKFRVNLRAMSFTPFSLGTNNLRFNFSTSALANPVIVSENFPSPDFAATTTTGSVASTGIMSINTSYNGAVNANSLPIPSTGIDLVTMEFDIINSSLTTNLSWRITGSNPKVAMVDDDKATIITVSGTSLDVPLQAVNAGADVTVNCTNPTATLTATGGGAPYLWSTGETTATIVVTPAITTTYVVTASNGSVDQVIVTTNKIPPIADAGLDVTLNCTVLSSTLTASGGALYLWSNGATTAAITVSPANTTTYTVTVTGANNCTATDQVIVTIDKTTPIANAGTDITVNCTNPSTILIATGGISYSWNNGATQNGTVSPTLTTIYTVTVTAANGCTASDDIVVTADKIAPNANAGLDVTVNCTSPSTILTATGGANYAWSNGMNTASTTVSPLVQTTYTVTVTGNNGCKASDAVIVTADKTAPTANAGADITTTCTTPSATLIASGGTNYAWSNGANTASTTVNPLVQTTYIVTVTGANGCTASDAVVVSVNKTTPNANAGADVTTTCTTPSTTLIATGGTNYAWSNGANTASTTVNPLTLTTYSVTVTGVNGCTASDAVVVSVNKTAPIANAGADVTITCLNPSTLLTATGGGTYTWNNGSNSASTSVQPVVTTTYTVTVTGANGCTASDDIIVTADKTAPIANAGVDVTTNCTGAVATLTASGGSTYLWNIGTTTASIVVSPATTTTYTVTATGTNGCTASDAVVVTVQNTVSYGVAFSNPIVRGNKFRVNLRLNACLPFSIGANNLRFNYNSLALSNPVIVSSAFPSPDFSASTTTGSVPSSGLLSVNTSYQGATNSNALPIPTLGIDVVVMEFDIINATLTSNLVWRVNGTNPKTAIVDDDKSTIIPNYAISNLDVPLQAVNAGVDVTVNCTNPTTTLTATGGTNYLWSTGATTATINVSPTITTTYAVTSTNGSTAIDEVIVSADKTAPIANAGADTSVDCTVTSATLTATGGVSYLWNNGATTASINVSPTITTTYNVTVTGLNGCKASDDVIVAFKLCSPVIIAKVFLNNLDINTLTMDNYLTTLQDFPLTDPYSTSPLNASFIHVNNNTVASISPTLLTVTGNNAVMDWVFLELRTGTSGATNVAYTKSAILQKDGDIVSTDGVSPVSFTGASAGNYYIAVRHRSHLGFRTLNTYALSGTPTTLNFTNNSVLLYGANPLIALSPTVSIMNSGDATPDGSIDAFDTIIWEQQNGLFDVYSNNADYNLDGSVDAFDTILWELNNGKFQDLD
jgi:YVTN family beta-propeller protein